MNVTYTINGIMFEWDSQKANLVLKNHKLSMQECASVLLDPMLITKEDFRDYGEQRFISVGFSNQARLLTVVWTPQPQSIRLITGFKATKEQSREYHHG